MLVRAAIPPATTFYPANVERFRARGRRATGLCPFHPDKNPSLSIDLDRGLFHCFVCDAGGDQLSFIMKRDGSDFVTAAKTLGAWGETPAVPRHRARRVVVGRDLVMTFSVDGTEYTAMEKDDARSYLDLLRRVYWLASDRLTEIRRGDGERFENEAETCWGIMADALPQIRAEERNAWK